MEHQNKFKNIMNYFKEDDEEEEEEDEDSYIKNKPKKLNIKQENNILTTNNIEKKEIENDSWDKDNNYNNNNNNNNYNNHEKIFSFGKNVVLSEDDNLCKTNPYELKNNYNYNNININNNINDKNYKNIYEDYRNSPFEKNNDINMSNNNEQNQKFFSRNDSDDLQKNEFLNIKNENLNNFSEVLETKIENKNYSHAYDEHNYDYDNDNIIKTKNINQHSETNFNIEDNIINKKNDLNFNSQDNENNFNNKEYLENNFSNRFENNNINEKEKEKENKNLYNDSNYKYKDKTNHENENEYESDILMGQNNKEIKYKSDKENNIYPELNNENNNIREKDNKISEFDNENNINYNNYNINEILKNNKTKKIEIEDNSKKELENIRHKYPKRKKNLVSSYSAYQPKPIHKSQTPDRNKNLNQFKMNKSSFKILLDSNEKLINKIISKFCINSNKISIVGISQSLSELKIVRELLKSVKNIETINLENLRYFVSDIIEKEVRKEEEVQFIEQIWFTMNPNNNEFINKEIFEGIIKLLFSYSYNFNTKNEICSYIKEYLNIVFFLEPKNNNNGEYYSILRDKIYIKEEIWPLEKIVDNFLKLKDNYIAYQTNYYQKEKLKKLINRKNLKENNINTTKDITKNKKHNFNKLYESYMAKIKIKEKTLEKLRELKKEEELSICQDRPNIIKKYQENNNIINPYLLTVHDKLYKMKDNKEKVLLRLKEKYSKDKKKEDFNLTFQPKKMRRIIHKGKIENPKGFERYVRRSRSFIQKKKEEKLKEQEKYTGSNYEKLRKMNIQPPKIKDMENYYKKEIEKICDKNQLSIPDFMNEENSLDNKEDFYSIQIKIPSGKSVTLKIYESDDINQKVKEFCKIYSLNDNIKRKIINKIKEFTQEEEEDDD